MPRKAAYCSSEPCEKFNFCWTLVFCVVLVVEKGDQLFSKLGFIDFAALLPPGAHNQQQYNQNLILSASLHPVALASPSSTLLLLESVNFQGPRDPPGPQDPLVIWDYPETSQTTWHGTN